MRIYFHLLDGSEEIRDPEGIEVPDLQVARAEAVRALEELRQEDQSAARSWSGWILNVTDGSGAVLLLLDLDGGVS